MIVRTISNVYTLITDNIYSFEYFFLATCSMDIPCLESNTKEATIHGLQPATAYLFEISVTTESNDLDSMSITRKCKTRPPKLTGTYDSSYISSSFQFRILIPNIQAT